MRMEYSEPEGGERRGSDEHTQVIVYFLGLHYCTLGDDHRHGISHGYKCDRHHIPKASGCHASATRAQHRNVHRHQMEFPLLPRPPSLLLTCV